MRLATAGLCLSKLLTTQSLFTRFYLSSLIVTPAGTFRSRCCFWFATNDAAGSTRSKTSPTLWEDFRSMPFPVNPPTHFSEKGHSHCQEEKERWVCETFAVDVYCKCICVEMLGVCGVSGAAEGPRLPLWIHVYDMNTNKHKQRSDQKNEKS